MIRNGNFILINEDEGNINIRTKTAASFTGSLTSFDCCFFFFTMLYKRLVLVNFTIVKLLIYTFFKKDFVNIFHLDIPV